MDQHQTTAVLGIELDRCVEAWIGQLAVGLNVGEQVEPIR
jgi:hypothetical protein